MSKSGANMAWNEPGKDDKKDQDPWNKNDKKNEQGPPDLDVVFQKISGILGGLFGKKPRKVQLAVMVAEASLLPLLLLLF